MKIYSLILLAVISSVSLAQSKYEGYVVIDEEMIGFFPCGGGKPKGLYLENQTGEKAYKKYKEKLREPLYFVFKAKTVENGEYGIGLVSEPAEEYLEITEINRIERHERTVCNAIIPLDVEIELLYKAP